MTLLNLSKVFDRDKRAISFRRLIEAAKQDSNLLPFAKVGQLAEIEKSVSGRESSSAWQSIKQKRDQQLAHLDAGPLQPVPLVKGDFDRFIEGIQSVFDQLWVMHSKSVYNSGHLHSRSAWMTGEVLRVLQEEAGKVALEANHQIRAIQQAEAQNQSQGRNQ
ncbi:MAG: hypothetical protein FJ316_13000 [SAR202 cluster bacterium]|nr:hypothetical protein [SAR202 cluster bacterium]